MLLVFVSFASVASADSGRNSITTGLDAGYYFPIGWTGANFGGGLGGSLFFGYSLTRELNIQLEYIPMVTATPTGDDVKDVFDTVTWGGVGQTGGLGGIGLSVKYFPRGRFKDADFVIVQPFVRGGLGMMSFVWTYSDDYIAAKQQADIDAGFEPGTYADADSMNMMYFNLGGGVDFMLAKFVSLGLDVRFWQHYVLSAETAEGTAKEDLPWGEKFAYFGEDFVSDLVISGGLSLTFQYW
jgi:hypothetical protein